MDARARALLEPRSQAKAKAKPKPKPKPKDIAAGSGGVGGGGARAKVTGGRLTNSTKTDDDNDHVDSANPNTPKPTSPPPRAIRDVPISPSRAPLYDPRALLNPKAARGRSSIQSVASNQPQSHSTSPNSSGAQAASLQRQNSGRSMLMDLYGVQARAAPPAKRVKPTISVDEDANDEPKQSTSGKHTTVRGSTGVIGEYLRPDSDGSAPAAAVLQSLIDLSNDDDGDDDVIITKSRNIMEDQEVCFGMLHTFVQAFLVPKPVAKSQFSVPNQWPLMKCNARRMKGQDTKIAVADPTDTTFGYIVHEVASVLAPIMDTIKRVRLQLRLKNRTKRSGEWPHAQCSQSLACWINVYGRRADVERVGKVFGQYNLWFRNPMGVEAGIPTVNPHEHRKVVVPQLSTPKGVSSHMHDTRTVEEATQAVAKVFDQFATSAPLEETEPSTEIRTTLLPHQKQALTFLLAHEEPRKFGFEGHENSSLWRKHKRKDGKEYYSEVVTGLNVSEPPPENLCGLLADVMGLGKTLETLALITSTKDKAEEFSRQRPDRRNAVEADIVVQSKATLIVAPLSTVKNWEDQIDEHVQPGAMRLYVHHGSYREKDPRKIAEWDVVVSTYGTIAAECSSKSGTISPIKQIKWFRIVLDEAHTIREPKASQSQAMYSLAASRRWCLTGTPIQNRLDDLASLLRFMRLYPYDTIPRFNQYIRAPAQSGDSNFLKSLRVCIDSFTLRRLKDRLDLPARRDLVVKLDFNSEERQLHDFFKKLSRVNLQEWEKRRKEEKGVSGMQHQQVLRGIMTLRLICAHGRELLKQTDLDKLKGQTADEPIDLDNDSAAPTITKRSAYQSLSMAIEADVDDCRQCYRKVSKMSPNTDDEALTNVHAYVLPCFDIICGACFPQFESLFLENQGLECPWCTMKISSQYIAIDEAAAEDLAIAPEDDFEGNDDAYQQGEYRGPHTKTLALLQDISEMKAASLELIRGGEPPLKCIVFSEFTSHLDLIERALKDRNYSFVRIDGTMSLPKRKKVLDELNTNNQVDILLASIKAAGQGLNLTAASRAFIMEPLWNPAAEAQAVDRIYRIGQNREVIITRYQMNDSIEGKIVLLQAKKQQLADISMNKNHQQLSKKENREQHMKDLAALFK